MKVIASAAISLDGCLNDTSGVRLKLSSPEDWEQVHRLRARCDAILVGAGTLRADNPSLVIKDPALREERFRLGLLPDIIKVTLSTDGNLDTSFKFFTEGAGDKIVFVSGDAPQENIARLSSVSTVVTLPVVDARSVVRTLSERGLKTLMVEGGSHTHTMFFAEDMVDELRLAVAPFFVGEAAAPRFVGAGLFPANKDHRMTLDSVEMLGDTTVMHYMTRHGADKLYLQQAIDESRKCTPTMSAYCVGAIIVTAGGEVFKGYTHETGPANHAEEEAIAKAIATGANLKGATMYSSMEPCSERKSKPVSCSQLILRHEFARAIFAYFEPRHFVDAQGAEILQNSGVEVTVIDSLAWQVREINKHILG